MRSKPDSGIAKQLIINETSPQYTTAGSHIKGPNKPSRVRRRGMVGRWPFSCGSKGDGCVRRGMVP